MSSPEANWARSLLIALTMSVVSCTVYSSELLDEAGSSASSVEQLPVPTIQQPSCADRLRNGDEADIDCGGSCARLCEVGSSCSFGLDCAPVPAEGLGLAVCAEGECRLTCPSSLGDCNRQSVDGCEVDLQLDPRHCGGCGAPCDLPHVEESGCSGGSCAIVSCDPGWMNCNGDASDGCEIAIDSDIDHCGACTAACSTQGGTPACVGGTCEIVCREGAADCDGDARYNGCETDIGRNTLHCAQCDRQCLTTEPGEVAFCAEGECGATICDPGWGDCDGDGVCSDRLDDENNCGACGRTCEVPAGVGACTLQGCEVESCPEGRLDCDGLFETGCESDPSGDIENCGACDVACGATGENVLSTSCALGACVTTCEPGYCSDGGAEGACLQPLGTEENCTLCGESCPLGQRCTEIGCSPYLPVVVLQEENFSSSIGDGWKSAGTLTLSQQASESRALVLLMATTVTEISMDARISWGTTNRHLVKEVVHRVEQSEAGVLYLLDDDLPPPGTEITLWFWAVDWWGGFVGSLLELDHVDQSRFASDEFTVRSASCPQSIRANAEVAKPGSMILAALNVNYSAVREGSPVGLMEIQDTFQDAQTNGLFGVAPLVTEEATVGWDVQNCWRWAMAGAVVQPAPVITQ